MDLNLGYTRLIIDTAKRHDLLRNQLAYVLATAYWETARTMKPVREAYWVNGAEAWRKKNLRYYPWYGRGFVQLTWERNYKLASKKLGVDFIAKPDDVMKPGHSAEILVIGSKEGWFTGKKLSDYITLQRSDFRGARRIINGTDKASAIAEIAREYDADLKREGYGERDTPAMHDPAEQVVRDAAADDRTSTTEVSQWMEWLGTGGIGSVLLGFGDKLNPYVFNGLIVAGAVAMLGFGAYRIRERRRKKAMARAVLE